MNSNALRVQKRLKKICPDCGEAHLVLIVNKVERDGVVYSKKFVYCPECEYTVEFKKKKDNNRPEFEDGL